MGFATASFPCGCSQTRLMEPREDSWIEWYRCSAHYTKADDAMIILAAKNKREYDEKLKRFYQQERSAEAERLHMEDADGNQREE
jgi:hypothetical protein